MKAYRNVAGNVVEIEIDVDLNGQPILPPDTTVDERPEAQEGHYVTVVGKEWVQIPVPQAFTSFETKQAEAQQAVVKYRNWYFDQPIVFNEVKFDADEQARTRLTQALVMQQANGYLPPAWISFDNTPVPVNTVDDLKAIANAVQVAFANRFFEMATLRGQIAAATTEEELALVEVPQVPNNGIPA